MTVFLLGHSFRYEIENIVRLFFPFSHFSYLTEGSPEGDYILTEIGEGKARVTVSFQGKEETEDCPLSLSLGKGEQEMTLCRLLFSLLEDMTGIHPAWGVITGVRPVKLLTSRIWQGQSRNEVRKEFSKEWMANQEKIDLCLETMDAQQPVIQSVKPLGYSLYISIPYCPTRCSYCSFVSQATALKKNRDGIPAYAEHLVKEIYFTAEIARKNGLSLRSVYMGGGTPTAVSPDILRSITDAVKEAFPFSDAIEYTIEAGRADTVTKEMLSVIRQSGATRISINPQTFQDDVLKRIGRQHTAAQVEEAFFLAREMGFSSINMDLIAGLPGDDFDGFCQSLERAIRLDPENITVHALTVKRGADLYTNGEYPMDPTVFQRMVQQAYLRLRQAGYFPYYLYRQKNTPGNLENVGYAKPGQINYYNIVMMEELQTVLGVGANAVTKLVGKNGIHRIYNFKYPDEYFSRFSDILAKKKEIDNFYGEEAKKYGK